MMENILKKYLDNLQEIIVRGDFREESFYHCLKEMIEEYARYKTIERCDITIQPQGTQAGNPGFRIWDGQARITGYIEAKNPQIYYLDGIVTDHQLQRYLKTFSNLILTNFYEFRLYQHGQFIESVTIASPINATQLLVAPPISHVQEFAALLDRYFSFSLPAITDPRELAKALAKRTSFLRDEIISIELTEEEGQDHKPLLNFYEVFKNMLISDLSKEQFADLYAQTLSYGIFAARTRSKGEFNRELIHRSIPETLGILKSVFKFISYEEPSQALAVLIDDIADLLYNTNIQEIMRNYYGEGRGNDPIVHFYETFLGEYDPDLRAKRGVYYTPEPVVRYIVRSIHSILKRDFNKEYGFASEDITILDPAAGTLTFPAEAIRLAIHEYSERIGSGGVHNLIKEHILPNFYAIELMMAPYTVGHLKISYLLAEHSYELAAGERFKLYLSNALDPDIPEQIILPIAQDISEESVLANQVKHQNPVLVILGNPPYSGTGQNKNAWTEQLLKTDLDGAQSYYTVDNAALGGMNPKWLQDDYVKFLRFAQWKIHTAGKGIVGMITNHSYLDNLTFRGMRQSLMKTFDEIYVLNLHGNTRRRERCPDGSADDNVFDIKVGTAIILMIKKEAHKALPDPALVDNNHVQNSELARVFHQDLYGLRQTKYDWLDSAEFDNGFYQETQLCSPFYLFRPEIPGNEHYQQWKSLPEIFPLNSVGIVSARDKLTIRDNIEQVRQTIHHFSSLEPETAKRAYNLRNDSSDWCIENAQKDLRDSDLQERNIVPILYRPFDTRYTYYTGRSSGFICRPRPNVMKHMLKDNVGIVVGRQGLAVGENQLWNLAFISRTITDFNLFYRGGGLLIPLYLYPDEQAADIFQKREYNISQELLAQFNGQWQNFEASQLFYYVYAVLYSDEYRQRFAEYLLLDFPRIPFTSDYQLFKNLANLGKELAELHLLNNPRLNELVVRYQGVGGNNSVSYVRYDEDSSTIRINGDKYFEGVSAYLWNYYIGGYQVLKKYLGDRKKKSIDNPVVFCKIATALEHTIQIKQEIDDLLIDIL